MAWSLQQMQLWTQRVDQESQTFLHHSPQLTQAHSACQVHKTILCLGHLGSDSRWILSWMWVVTCGPSLGRARWGGRTKAKPSSSVCFFFWNMWKNLLGKKKYRLAGRRTSLTSSVILAGNCFHYCIYWVNSSFHHFIGHRSSFLSWLPHISPYISKIAAMFHRPIGQGTI